MFTDSNRSSLGFPIQLDGSGLTLLISNSPQRVSVVDVMHNLYNPTKILKNVIVALIQASEKNQEKVRELQLALRFANAIFEGSDSLA
jgi:hypothetical protein